MYMLNIVTIWYMEKVYINKCFANITIQGVGEMHVNKYGILKIEEDYYDDYEELSETIEVV